jgi:hypothetical protein
MFRRLKFVLDERLLDDDLCRDVREFTSLPRFHLPAHRFEVALHAITPDRYAVDHRQRLRVFCQHRRKVALNGHDDGLSADSHHPSRPRVEYPLRFDVNPLRHPVAGRDDSSLRKEERDTIPKPSA